MVRKIYFILLALLTVGMTTKSGAQSFDFELTGNPVDITGWTMSNQSSVDGDEIVLTQPNQNQAGYIYYDSAQNLANCSQFTVTFDFKITNQSVPPADGIAFWYITNPPSNFTSGGSIGMPSNPTGLLLILDTYDNDGNNNNPVVSLRKMSGGTYSEASTSGELVPDLTYQSFITDGNWHTCKLKYYYGTVTVSFDGNPPAMTASTTLNLNGYFGFSAGTGAKWSKHQIKNISIVGAPNPDAPTADTVFYCQNAIADTLTAIPDSNLLWYNTDTGNIALPGAPVPPTGVPDTQTWYVAQEVPGCNIESNRSPVVAVVRPLPDPPVVSVPIYCSGQPGATIQTPGTTQIKWYTSDSATNGTVVTPTINTDTPANYVWYLTQTDSFGCESLKDSIIVDVHKTPVADFDYTMGLACSGNDTVILNNQSNYATHYLWREGYAQLTDTVTNPKFVYYNDGSYFITLIAKNDYCKDSVIKPVEIGHPLIADFTASNDTICEGTKVNFDNYSTTTTINGVTPGNKWYFGNGDSSLTTNSSYTFDTPGDYPVRLVVSNGIPCYDTMTHYIIVDSTAQLNVNINDTAFCKGDNVLLTENATQNGLLHSWWIFSDGPDSVADVNPVSHAFDQSGTFTITLKNKYRACPDTGTQFTVHVHPVPYLNLGPDTSICLGGAPLILSDTGNMNNPAAHWLWNTGETTSQITIHHQGLYWAKVTIDNCSTKDEVMVDKDCYMDIPNSFTPNNDGHNDYFLPRRLLSNGVVGFKMSIYNRWGEKIFETSNRQGRGWDGTLNGKAQPQGVYVYVIVVVYHNGRSEQYKGNLTLLR